MYINPVCDAIRQFVKDRGGLCEANLLHLIRSVPESTIAEDICWGMPLPPGKAEEVIGKSLAMLVRAGQFDLMIKNGQIYLVWRQNMTRLTFGQRMDLASKFIGYPLVLLFLGCVLTGAGVGLLTIEELRIGVVPLIIGIFGLILAFVLFERGLKLRFQ